MGSTINLHLGFLVEGVSVRVRVPLSATHVWHTPIHLPGRIQEARSRGAARARPFLQHRLKGS